jgi:hypothetical protein
MCFLILINGSQMAQSICDEISDIELVTRRRKALIMHVSEMLATVTKRSLAVAEGE